MRSRPLHRVLRVGATSFVALGVLLRASSAHCQSDAAIAEVLFQEAKRLMSSGDVKGACAKFAESERLAPKLGTLLNLATCHEKDGKLASAWSEFTDAATLATRAGDSRAAYAQQHARALEGQLARLTITVKTPTPGLTVTVDGHVVGAAAWGTPIPVDAGDHTIEATAQGFRSWSGSASAAVGSAAQNVEVPALEALPAEEAKPAPAPVAPGPSKEPPPDNGDAKSNGAPQRTAGGVMIGVGVAGLIVGGVFGVRAFSLKSASEPNCGLDNDPNLCNHDGKVDRDNAKTSAVISTIAFAAGGVLAVGGLALVLTAPSGRSSTTSGKSRGTHALWVTPQFAADGAAVDVATKW